MKCYLGDGCIHPVEMLEYLRSSENEDFDSTNGFVPFSARNHCIEINCCVYEKICQLADEYRTYRASHTQKSAR